MKIASKGVSISYRGKEIVISEDLIDNYEIDVDFDAQVINYIVLIISANNAKKVEGFYQYVTERSDINKISLGTESGTTLDLNFSGKSALNSHVKVLTNDSGDVLFIYRAKEDMEGFNTLAQNIDLSGTLIKDRIFDFKDLDHLPLNDFKLVKDDEFNKGLTEILGKKVSIDGVYLTSGKKPNSGKDDDPKIEEFKPKGGNN